MSNITSESTFMWAVKEKETPKYIGKFSNMAYWIGSNNCEFNCPDFIFKNYKMVNVFYTQAELKLILAGENIDWDILKNNDTGEIIFNSYVNKYGPFVLKKLKV
jgi:hypothetical protein